MGISAVHSTRSAATNGLRRWSQTGIYPLNPSWLSDALVFIRQNINQNLSAADVYAAVGKSHTIVDRAFMKALGTSVKQTIIRFRLEEAYHLIQDTPPLAGPVPRRIRESSALFKLNRGGFWLQSE